MWDKALAFEDAAGALWSRSREMTRIIKGDCSARLLLTAC